MSQRPRRPTSDAASSGDEPCPTRRRLLGALGAFGAATVAGCLSVAGRSPPGSDDDPPITRRVEVLADYRPVDVEVTVPAAVHRRVEDADHSIPAAFAATQRRGYLAAIAGTCRSRVETRAAGVRTAQALAARIEYATDRDSTGKAEFVRYPAETLVDGVGDCEDKAILLAGLLASDPFGCHTALVLPEGHCATLVARPDLPDELVAPDPLTVALGDTEYVYVEAVESVRPGRTARDYGERPRPVAYDGRWHVLDAGAVLGSVRETIDERRLAAVGGLV